MKLSEIELKKGDVIELENGRNFNIAEDNAKVYINDNNIVMVYMPFFMGNCYGYNYQPIGKAVRVKHESL